MKKIFLLLPLTFVLVGCSGLAPEAVRDENNGLTKPPFMEKDLADRSKDTPEAS